MNNSALKTLKILSFIAEATSPLGVSEISRALGYAKSTVFDILTVLREEGFLEYADEVAKTFQIGISSYRIGSVYLKNTGLHKVARPAMERLARETGETVFLAIEDNGFVFYLDKVIGSSPFVFMCDIGARNLMQVTGVGKAMLAGYSDQEIIRLIGDKFEKRTKNTLTNIDDLFTEIREIRENGYAIDHGEDNEMVRCVGAAIRNHTNKVVAGISVSMLENSFNDEKKQKTIFAVTNAAKGISEKLGYLKDH